MSLTGNVVNGMIVLDQPTVLPEGTWTSKLGKYLDINHTLRGIEGSVYGQVVAFMKRPAQG